MTVEALLRGVRVTLPGRPAAELEAANVVVVAMVEVMVPLLVFATGFVYFTEREPDRSLESMERSN